MKATKSGLKRKLDKEFSRVIRSQGKCCKCGKDDYSKLQAAHIFSRSMLSVRWDFDNVLCLCAGCHFEAHAKPVLFTEFVRQFLGELKYEQLKSKAMAIKKWTLPEMEILLGILKNTY